MRGLYLIGPTKKSTFYDNYGPSGKWTKAAEGASKLTSFFSSKNKEITENETDDDIEETFMGDEWNFKEMELKIEELKEELKSSQYKMSVIEYNKKRAIFEMLKRINKQKTISDSTARRWLNVLGFFNQQQKQGVYFDGHERDDVVKY